MALAPSRGKRGEPPFRLLRECRLDHVSQKKSVIERLQDGEREEPQRQTKAADSTAGKTDACSLPEDQRVSRPHTTAMTSLVLTSASVVVSACDDPPDVVTIR